LLRGKDLVDSTSPIKPFRVKRFLQELNRFGARRSSEGVHRLAYSEPDMAARRMLAEKLRALDLHLYSDAVGNLAALTRPVDPDTPFILVGSHLDTSGESARYGGALGIAAGLELLQQRAEGALEPRLPLGLVCFACGEPARFGISGLGARYFTGEIDDRDLELFDEVAASGRPPRSLAQLLSEKKVARTVKRWENLSLFSGGPEQSLRHIEVAAFLELAVDEQNRSRRPPKSLGVVSRVAAPVWVSITLSRQAGPSQDATPRKRGELFRLAMEVWQRFEAYCESRPRLSRAIVGMSTPGWRWERSTDTLEMHVEISSTSAKRRNRALIHLRHLFNRQASKRPVSLSRFEVVLRTRPVKMNAGLNRALTRSARRLGIKTRALPLMEESGASVMARRYPGALLLLPCPPGAGLVPGEPAELQRVAAAVQLMLETTKGLTGAKRGAKKL
jgi:hypothetical protein